MPIYWNAHIPQPAQPPLHPSVLATYEANMSAKRSIITYPEYVLGIQQLLGNATIFFPSHLGTSALHACEVKSTSVLRSTRTAVWVLKYIITNDCSSCDLWTEQLARISWSAMTPLLGSPTKFLSRSTRYPLWYVNCSCLSGRCKFLILDVHLPDAHYTVLR